MKEIFPDSCNADVRKDRSRSGAFPASQFPRLVAEQVRNLVEHGFIEEAQDAAGSGEAI